MKENRTYLAIDMKSFYASVECQERGLNPLTTHLVVADVSRTEKTICLAVSPSLKAYGIPGRARLFEVVTKVREVNARRLQKSPGHRFTDKSYDADRLAADPSLELTYIAAVPRMALYMEYSTRVYQIYLRYISSQDIHVYSIDEVLMDVTDYLGTYGLTARELAKKMVREVYQEIGITATVGIGTNLYLAKVAMDIMAKHVAPDQDGVRIAELDEISYRRQLWSHRPLRDFWRVGPGYVRKLEENGMYTMGDIARCSLGKPGSFWNEDLLYRLFGVNAELLIDHAWGWEPCTMDLIKAYKPDNKSFSSGQVLPEPYSAGKTRTVVHEMAEAAALSLVEKQMVTDQLFLTIGYDISNLNPGGRTGNDPADRAAAAGGAYSSDRSTGSGSSGAADRKDSMNSMADGVSSYRGEISTDYYGRKIPKHAHGTANLDRLTSSGKLISKAVLELYDRIINPDLLIRRIYLGVNHVVSEEEAAAKADDTFEQLDLFTDYQALEEKRKKEEEALSKEKKLQKAMLDIRKKYGNNSIVKGLNMKEESTGLERNKYIGGHKA